MNHLPTDHTYLPPRTYLAQDVDAKARRSLNKTFLYKDERRSLNKTLTRRHAARSTRLDDVDLDDPRLDWRWPCDL